VQHALVSSHIATAQSQLTRTHEDVSRVVDALKPILAAAPNPATQDDAEAPAVSRPSFRLVYRSGNSPPVNQKDRPVVGCPATSWPTCSATCIHGS